MIIKKVKLENIRSYEDAEIEFPLGSIVLSGDIGSGKTSILLAIEFALFGLQPGQKGSSLLRNQANEGSVYLELEIDNKNIIIERRLKRGKSVNQSYASIDEGKGKKEISVTELKNKVLSLLNYPREFAKKTNLLYRFTVYTPQEEMKQIILESAETRLNTLRHIFGIDKYKRIRENTQILTAKLRERIRMYEGEIKNFEELRKKADEKKENLKNLEKNLEKLKIELKKRMEERKKAEEDIKQVEEKIKEKEMYEREAEKTKIMLIGKKELLTGIDNEKENIMKEIEEARKLKFDYSQLEEIREQLRGKEKETEENTKQHIDLLSKIKSLDSKILEAQELKKQILSLKLCPTCLQDVSEEYKINIVRKFEDNIVKCKNEKGNLESDKNMLIKKIDILKNQISKLDDKLEELNLIKLNLELVKEKEVKLEDLDKQKSLADKDILLLEKQIQTLKESSSLLKKYDNIYETKRKHLREIEKKEREKELELASIEKEKQLTIKMIEEIEKEIKEKLRVKKKLQETGELEDWLSSSFLGIISLTERNIMLKLREEFSKLFNEWFNILVPEIFTVRLDEDFTPIIEQHDFQLEYSFLSGGERTAIALAYRLALNQVINSLLSKIKTRDLVILDEPTEGFSEQQLDKMRDVLNELKVKQLIIVSHESKIESFVENIIKFRKEAGFSIIGK